MRRKSPRRPALAATALAGVLLTGCSAPSPVPTSSASIARPSQESAVLARADSHHLLKSTNAKAALVLFTDFQCPYCAEIDPLIRQVAKDYAGRINVVVRNLPLPMHQNAGPGAQAVEAAASQGKLSEMMGLVLGGQAEWSKAANPQPVFTEYAQRLGLDAEKFAAAYSSAAVQERISRDYSDAVALGLRGTPSLILNGKMLRLDSYTYDEIKVPLDAALAS
ncbi:DsbA family protein [Arthrobacter sp. MA-N2]|uniref:DsbA family protein n=1 Tax=Arthrobacter sp. MA-N2 TaxID=1101188 RepID=UPI0018CC0C0B|nr:thioredoxin domain-containing protein [Arthrobacter sp. MA-N2]